MKRYAKPSALVSVPLMPERLDESCEKSYRKRGNFAFERSPAIRAKCSPRTESYVLSRVSQISSPARDHNCPAWPASFPETGQGSAHRNTTQVCSGGRIALAPSGLSYVGRLSRPRSKPATPIEKRISAIVRPQIQPRRPSRETAAQPDDTSAPSPAS